MTFVCAKMENNSSESDDTPLETLAMKAKIYYNQKYSAAWEKNVRRSVKNKYTKGKA